MKFTIVATFFLVVVQLQSVLGAPTSDIETSSSPPHPRPSKRLKTVSFTEKVLSSEACKTGDPVSLRQLQAEYAQLGETHQTNLEVTVDGIVSSFSVDSIFINCHPSITTWILFDLLQQDVFEGGYFQEWLQHVFNEAALRGNLKLMKAIYAEIPSNEERFELIKMEDQHPENEYVAFVEACQAGQLESAAQLHRWHLDLIQVLNPPASPLNTRSMIQHERDLLAHIITENEFFPFVNAAIRNHLKMVRDIWEWVGEAAFSSSTSLHREMLAANNYIAFTAAADEGVESLAMLRQLYFWSGSKGERQEALKADEYQAFFGAACGIKANLDMVKQILEWGVEEGLEKEMLTSLDQRRGTHEFKDDIAQFIKQVKGGVR